MGNYTDKGQVKKKGTPKPNDTAVKQDGRYKIAQITRRKCSEKLQPRIKVGQRYFIVGLDRTKSGAEVLILADIFKAGKGENLPVIRCNSERFEWKVFTQTELVRESSVSAVPQEYSGLYSPEDARMNIMQKIASKTKIIMNGLDEQEQLRVSFVPLIINNLAWMYAEKVKQCAARDKIELLRDHSRTLKKIAEEYDRDIREFLDPKHVYKAVEQTRKCAAEMQNDLTILFFTVRAEFLKVAPDYPYGEMRSYALISILFIRFLEEWNAEMDEFLKAKFKEAKFRESVIPPSTMKLRSLMKAFAGIEKFNYDEYNITTSMRVIKNRINKIKFSIT